VSAHFSVLLTLLFFFVGIEIGVRYLLVERSTEFLTAARYQKAAALLAHREGFRMVVIGNSLVGHGVDPALLGESLGNIGGQAMALEVMHLPGSSLLTWQKMLDRFFWKSEQPPIDLFVVVYAMEDGLADGRPSIHNLGRIATYYSGFEDWPELFRTGITSTSDRIWFGIASVWDMFSLSEGLSHRILGFLIPNYEAAQIRVHPAKRSAQQPITTSPAEKQWTYRTLERFLATAAERGSRVCIVAYPGQYLIDPKILQIVQTHQANLIDMRSREQLKKEHFTDGFHMNERGRQIFTRALGVRLKGFIQNEQRAGC
jgi:hypothetical protein